MRSRANKFVCMAYVDLNPIRAKIADTPETSEHTSIEQRMKAIQQSYKHSLMPFVSKPRQDIQGIAFSLKDDCGLVNIKGRIVRNDKAGHIDHQRQPILQSLGLSDEQWLTLTTGFKKYFCCAAGAEMMMNQSKEHTGINAFAAWAKRKHCYAVHKFKNLNKFIALLIPTV